MTIKSRTLALVLGIGLLCIPVFVSAKTAHLKGYERGKGQTISVKDPLGWPVSLRTNSYNNASIESLPGMAVIRVKPYNPWWHFYGGIPKETTATVSGLPPNTDLHVYTKGYREHEVKHTDAKGMLTFTFPAKPGARIIIKTKPSTYRIQVGGLIFAKGGDCSIIGAWNETTKTCTLTKDVSESIVIEDPDITLNGNGKSVSGSGPGSGDGIFTDESRVTVMNVEVHNFDQGIVYADALLTFASGGTINQVTVADSTRGIVDEGISNLTIKNSNIVHQTTGIKLVDQLDGHPTDNISITRNNFKQNGTDMFNDGTSFTLSTTADRGNYWNKNDTCNQDPANHSHCTGSYDTGPATDNLPWACESGWTHTCPFIAPTPTPTPTATPGGTATPTPTEIPPLSGPCKEGGSMAETVVAGRERVPVYDSADAGSPKLKEVPAGWVFDVLERNSIFWKIRDRGDGTVGFVDSKHLCDAQDQQNDFQNRSDVYDDPTADKSKRMDSIREAINVYFGNSDNTANLYAIGNVINDNKFDEINTFSKFRAIVSSIATSETGGGSNFNNRVCSSDILGGMGIMQLTSGGTKGGGSDIINNFGSPAVNHDDCKGYSGVVSNRGYYYSNSRQGIFANIKDGIRVFRQKYNGTNLKKLIEQPGISKEELHFASAIYRYNQGSPFKAQILFEAMVAKESGKDLYDKLVANGYRRVLVDQTLLGSQDNTISWLDGIKKICPNYTDDQFGKCLRNAETTVFKVINKTNIYYIVSPLYLEKVGKNMINNPFGFSDADYGKKLIQINDSQLVLSIASPVELRAVDISGNITGVVAGKIFEDVGNSLYQPENESATLFFPAANNEYKIVGTGRGAYSFSTILMNGDNAQRFIALDIPTSPSEVHTYSFDWEKLSKNTRDAVTISVDFEGDGIIDAILKSDRTLTSQEFNKGIGGKVTVCHRPPGNPKNAHTISVGRPAMKAHLKHGDSEGSCEDKENQREEDNKKKDKEHTDEKKNQPVPKSESKDNQDDKKGKSKKNK